MKLRRFAFAFVIVAMAYFALAVLVSPGAAQLWA